MKLLVLFVFFSYFTVLGYTNAAAENWSNIGKFVEWIVYGYEHEFEGERRFEVFTAIRDSEKKHIGIVKLSQREFSPGDVGGISVYFSIKDSTGAWPECDHDFLKYKIDTNESAYWPSEPGQCNTHYASSALLRNMKKGQSLRLKHKNGVALFDLSGFTKAWEAGQDFITRR